MSITDRIFPSSPSDEKGGSSFGKSQLWHFQLIIEFIEKF